ncbi:MAG TPA: hypothetical protein VHC19_16200 [Pirellulales bacterium]|jgi:hypothetical protein|nr:hypothetical protein [Pirellulales bacterium]
MDPFGAWQPQPPAGALQSVWVGDVVLKPGDRVRLTPAGGADPFDLLLKGKTATIASIEQDFEDTIHLAVTIDDDPGRDFGEQLQPGHRFFFKLEEIEPLEGELRSETP